MKTYFDVLGVNPEADTKTIRKAYRELVKRYHPDVSRVHNSARIFEEINAAYGVLSSPEKKAAYLRSLNDKTAAEKKTQDRFRFREFRNWLFSLSLIKALFVGKKVSKPAEKGPAVDPAILRMPPAELLKRVLYSNNRFVQTAAVKALAAQNRENMKNELIRLLYLNLHEEVKLTILEALKCATDSRCRQSVMDLMDTEKSVKVRQAMRRFVEAAPAGA